MDDESIAIVTVEPLTLAAVRRQVTAATLMAEAMKAPVWTLVQRRGLETPGNMVFVFEDDPSHMLINRPGGVSVDIGVVVDRAFESDQLLRCITTPGGRVVRARHRGHYELLPTIHGDIRAWCISEGHAISGLNWEYYWHWHEDPKRRITDVHYMLEK